MKGLSVFFGGKGIGGGENKYLAGQIEYPGHNLCVSDHLFCKEAGLKVSYTYTHITASEKEKTDSKSEMSG